MLITLGISAAQIENQILDLLAQNLHRLNDVEESDGQGMFHTLGQFTPMLECSVAPLLTSRFCAIQG